MDTQSTPSTPSTAAPAPTAPTTGHDRRWSRRARRGIPAATAVALLALGAAACGSDGGDGGGSNSTGTAPAAATTSAGTPATTAPQTPAPTTEPGAPATTAPAAPPSSAGAAAASSRCLATELGLSLGRGDPGAGNVYYPLTLTNKSSHTCVLNGYPGVSLIKRDGGTIGKPADRTGVKFGAVSLAPGKSAEADLHTINKGLKGNGCWSAPDLLKVYPPGSKDSMTLRTSAPVVCGDTFDVGPLHVGSPQ
jgi:hypothetical protein